MVERTQERKMLKRLAFQILTTSITAAEIEEAEGEEVGMVDVEEIKIMEAEGGIQVVEIIKEVILMINKEDTRHKKSKAGFTIKIKVAIIITRNKETPSIIRIDRGIHTNNIKRKEGVDISKIREAIKREAEEVETGVTVAVEEVEIGEMAVMVAMVEVVEVELGGMVELEDLGVVEVELGVVAELEGQEVAELEVQEAEDKNIKEKIRMIMKHDSHCLPTYS